MFDGHQAGGQTAGREHDIRQPGSGTARTNRGRAARRAAAQHWVTEASDCEYISPAEAIQLNSDLEEIGRMLNSMMAKADSFCGPLDGRLREDTVEYFTNY